MRNIHKWMLIVACAVVLAACGDAIENIESSNQYSWQRYMNEAEFEQLEEGMTYEQVVEIVRGGADKINGGTYTWHDEKMMTVTYDVTFEGERLTKKERVMIQGHSTRDLAGVEKEPAQPE